MDWLQRFTTAAKSKWTTYVALGLAALATIPDTLPAAWESISAFLPKHWDHDQILHGALAAGYLAIMVLRVRREIRK